MLISLWDLYECRGRNTGGAVEGDLISVFLEEEVDFVASDMVVGNDVVEGRQSPGDQSDVEIAGTAHQISQGFFLKKFFSILI